MIRSHTPRRHDGKVCAQRHGACIPSSIMDDQQLREMMEKLRQLRQHAAAMDKRREDLERLIEAAEKAIKAESDRRSS